MSNGLVTCLSRAAVALAAALLCSMPMSACASGAPVPDKADRAELLPAATKPVEGEVQALDGAKVQLAALRGHPVLLDFFATWCEPCRAGLPRTDALVQKNLSRGLVGWAVSIDEKPDAVGPFIQKLGVVLPVKWDPGGHTADAVGVELLPSLVLLDARGALRYRAAPDDPHADRHVEEALEALLAESKP